MNANIQRPTSNVQRSTKDSLSTARTQSYDLEERLLEFASRIIKLVETLPKSRAGNHIAGQLLRSGTSALPNHGEAQAAGLIKPPLRVQSLLEETDELIRIFVASIKTAEKRKLGVNAPVQHQNRTSAHA